ncbi:MAG: endolytic transglycosylase MltG [Geodermatophilaceae bacterium]|nr:endolytic transglycosylase MltG [Geodermatophilaceae bacterium]
MGVRGTVTDEDGGDLSLLVDTDRPAGTRARHRRRRRTRSALGSALAVVVIAALVVGVFIGGRALIGAFDGFGDVPDYTGSGSGPVQIRINQGDTAADIATTLFEADVIKSERAFRDAATENQESLSIQPGLYEIRMQLPATTALELLLDPVSRLTEIVTIPEGFTQEQTLLALSEATEIPLVEFETAANQVESLGLPAYAAGRLEGFLFPATYTFDPEDGPLEMLQQLVAQFTTVASSLDLEARAAQLGVLPYDVVVIASMIQSESRIDAERPMIAQVVYNRLQQNIPLGIDATTAYDLGKPGTELTTEDFQIDSPYNTRLNVGLPPTPISSPGEASLEAALAPVPGDWIYYVLENAEGNHFFTASAAEFEAAKARCQAAGLGCG